jgi:hypothetical protein
MTIGINVFLFIILIIHRPVVGIIGAPIILGRCPSLSAHENESMLRTYLVCREKQDTERERERNKQTTYGRRTQYTNNSDPLTSSSELLLRQNSVTAHVHQCYSRRLASDHCATEIHRPKSAVRPIGLFNRLKRVGVSHPLT